MSQTKKKSGCLYLWKYCCRYDSYTGLSRSLEYLLKITCFVQNYSKVAGFSIFKTLCSDRSKIYEWKKYHKNEQYLCLVTHIFTKLLQNVCLINTHILIYRHARCNCKLWNYSITNFNKLKVIFIIWCQICHFNMYECLFWYVSSVLRVRPFSLLSLSCRTTERQKWNPINSLMFQT